MRRFLIYIISLLVLTCVLGYTIQYMADLGMKRFEKGILKEWTQIYSGAINAKSIILGSSRAYTGYDPTILTDNLGIKTYNLSANGGGYNIQKMKYDLYVDTNVKPKVVIQNVDLSHFIASHKVFEEYQYISYFSNDIIKETLPIIDEKYKYYTIVPLLKYNTNREYLKRSLRTLLFNKVYNEIELIDGFCPKNKKFRLDSLNIERFRRLDTSINYTDKFESGYKHTTDFATSLSDQSIVTIFVWAPEFIKRLEANKNLRTYYSKKLKQFAQSNSNIHFLNLATDTISYDESNYYDSFHLSAKGAKSFSKKLAVKIDSLMIENKTLK